MATSNNNVTMENILLPSSTMTPTPPLSNNTGTQQQETTTGQPAVNITISILSPSSAADTSLIQTLTRIINAAYLETESDIWNPGFQRTTTDEVANLIRKGEIAVAYHHRDSTLDQEEGKDSHGTPIGCVHIQLRNPTTAEFGMLALDPTFRGGGTGRQLALFAEDYARRTLFSSYRDSKATHTDTELKESGGVEMDVPKMQLHLLVPSTFEHKFKMRLRGWYQRMGYQEVSHGGGDGEEGERSMGKDVASEFPELAPLLAGPALFYVFEKKLF